MSSSESRIPVVMITSARFSGRFFDTEQDYPLQSLSLLLVVYKLALDNRAYSMPRGHKECGRLRTRFLFECMTYIVHTCNEISYSTSTYSDGDYTDIYL